MQLPRPVVAGSTTGQKTHINPFEDLQILTKPPIDTLWLDPLAFPRNPYHRLVKHYKDGRLQADVRRQNEWDSRGCYLTEALVQLG